MGDLIASLRDDERQVAPCRDLKMGIFGSLKTSDDRQIGRVLVTLTDTVFGEWFLGAEI